MVISCSRVSKRYSDNSGRYLCTGHYAKSRIRNKNADKSSGLRSKGDKFTIEDVTLSEPADNQILVKIVGAGLCHTDLIELYKQSKFPFDKLINYYTLDEINQAAEDS